MIVKHRRKILTAGRAVDLFVSKYDEYVKEEPNTGRKNGKFAPEVKYEKFITQGVNKLKDEGFSTFG